MIPTPQHHHLATSKWIDRLAGDFLWTNKNSYETTCDVMTPAIYSMWKISMEAVLIQIPGCSLVGVS